MRGRSSGVRGRCTGCAGGAQGARQMHRMHGARARVAGRHSGPRPELINSRSPSDRPMGRPPCTRAHHIHPAHGQRPPRTGHDIRDRYTDRAAGARTVRGGYSEREVLGVRGRRTGCAGGVEGAREVVGVRAGAQDARGTRAVGELITAHPVLGPTDGHPTLTRAHRTHPARGQRPPRTGHDLRDGYTDCATGAQGARQVRGPRGRYTTCATGTQTARQVHKVRGRCAGPAAGTRMRGRCTRCAAGTRGPRQTLAVSGRHPR